MLLNNEVSRDTTLCWRYNTTVQLYIQIHSRQG